VSRDVEDKETTRRSMMRYIRFGMTSLCFFITTACGDDTSGDGDTTGSGAASSGGSSAGGAGGESTGGSGGEPAGGGGGVGGAGSLPFGADCTDSEECESGVCYPFGMGPKCTVECPPDPADCPGPVKECNNMDPAVCKV
jgi:hypothetical protein